MLFIKKGRTLRRRWKLNNSSPALGNYRSLDIYLQNTIEKRGEIYRCRREKRLELDYIKHEHQTPATYITSNILLQLHNIKLDLLNNLATQIINAKYNHDQETKKIKCKFLLEPNNTITGYQRIIMEEHFACNHNSLPIPECVDSSIFTYIASWETKKITTVTTESIDIKFLVIACHQLATLQMSVHFIILVGTSAKSDLSLFSTNYLTDVAISLIFYPCNGITAVRMTIAWHHNT